MRLFNSDISINLLFFIAIGVVNIDMNVVVSTVQNAKLVIVIPILSIGDSIAKITEDNNIAPIPRSFKMFLIGDNISLVLEGALRMYEPIVTINTPIIPHIVGTSDNIINPVIIKNTGTNDGIGITDDMSDVFIERIYITTPIDATNAVIIEITIMPDVNVDIPIIRVMEKTLSTRKCSFPYYKRCIDIMHLYKICSDCR